MITPTIMGGPQGPYTLYQFDRYRYRYRYRHYRYRYRHRYTLHQLDNDDIALIVTVLLTNEYRWLQTSGN
jgi:hypothetical protein